MGTTSEKFYDRFAWFYPAVEIFLKAQKRMFFKEINQHPHGKLLEIGLGNGTNLKYYDKHDVTGVDTSQNMLAQARKIQNSKAALFHMDGETLSFQDASYDYVVLSHVIAVVENPDQLLDEVYRVLKPSGRVFILNHFTPDNPLKYVDKVFSSISPLFHFRSEFRTASLQKAQRFKLINELNAGLWSYFKILVFEKNR